MFPWLNLAWKVNVLVSLRCLWPRPIDISSLFSFLILQRPPVAVVVLSRLCFEVYDVARLMKCWYSELAISKSSVIQGSKYIRHVGDFCMRCCTCLNYFSCLLSDPLTRFNSCCFFVLRLVLWGFSFQFIPVPSFLVNLL